MTDKACRANTAGWIGAMLGLAVVFLGVMLLADLDSSTVGALAAVFAAIMGGTSVLATQKAGCGGGCVLSRVMRRKPKSVEEAPNPYAELR